MCKGKRNCPVRGCRKHVKLGDMPHHFKTEHPDYKMWVDENGKVHCGYCGHTVCSYPELVRHTNHICKTELRKARKALRAKKAFAGSADISKTPGVMPGMMLGNVKQTPGTECLFCIIGQSTREIPLKDGGCVVVYEKCDMCNGTGVL